jgi:hypothetical protein
MKVKSWQVVCLLVVVAAALYFLVAVREGLDDPKCPAGAPGISSVTLTGGQKVRLYTQSECSTLGGNFAANGKKNWGMANDSVGECLGTSNGINVGFCSQDAAPSAAAAQAIGGSGSSAPGCPSHGEGITSVKQSGGFNVRMYTAGECSALGGNFAGNGAKNWGMANDSVGECLGVPGGVNIGFCNQSSPPSAAAQAAVAPPAAPGTPAAPAAPAITPSVPAPATPPTTTSPGSPSYSLSCMAAPVSGMVGSAAAMPETPAAWNVNQPPSGWNSKNGYTTGGWRK